MVVRLGEDGKVARQGDQVAIGKDVYVIQSLHGGPSMSANDKLNRLLFFIGALKDAGAARVTAVVPSTMRASNGRPISSSAISETREQAPGA